MLTAWSRQSRRKSPANMTNRRRPNDGSGLVKGLLKRPALQPGCVDGTHRSPVMFYTQVFALYEHLRRHVLHTGGGRGPHKERQFGGRVLDFTYTLRVVFYNRGDRPDSGELPIREYLRPVSSHPFPSHHVSSCSFRHRWDLAQVLRSSWSMEATQSYPNLLSEKQ